MFVFNGTSEFISIILRDDEREIIKSFWYDLRNDIALTDNFNYDIFPLKRDLDMMKHYCKLLNFSKSFFTSTVRTFNWFKTLNSNVLDKPC